MADFPNTEEPRHAADRSDDANLESALSAFTTQVPSAQAWKVLVRIADEIHGDQSFAYLANALTQSLRQHHSKARTRAISVTASIVAQSPDGSKMLPWLAEQPQATAYRLALAILVRLGAGLPADDVRSFLPLLSHKRLPTREAVIAAAKLLQFLGKNESDVALASEALAAARPRKRAIARLTLLEKRLGSSSALQSVRQRLINQTKMRCPKCAIKLPRGEMVGHLWQEHQLILQADKARMPWNVLEDWITHHGDEQDGILLDPCRTLVRQLDPVAGSLRLERLILAKGIDDVKARRFLIDKAAEAYACLCPHCFALVSRPRPAFVNKLVVTHRRIGFMGYNVEINETGLFPRLLVQTPRQILFHGREPSSRMTRKGTFLAISPLLLAALVVALGFVPLGMRVLIPVTFLLLVSLVLILRDRAERRKIVKTPVRALGYAWNLLAPSLHTPAFNQDDAAFLSGLAVLTATRESFLVARRVLETCLAETERAVGAGSAESVYLAALRRLVIAEQVVEGKDAITEVGKQIGRCFDGPLSLHYADELLDGWKADWLTKPALARLRVLICDKAFESGFELASLRHAVRNKPLLRELIGVKDMRALAQLRLLWSQRPRRPWDRYGKAKTAFEVAEEDMGAKWLGRYPDLLLLVDLDPDHYARPAKRSRTEYDLVICSRGLALQGKIISEAPQRVDWEKAKRSEGSGYHLNVGEHSFHYDDEPEEIARKIERWCRYYFLEFRPQADDVIHWQAPDNPSRMRARGAVECRECQGWMLPRVGEMGLPLDDPDPITFQVID